MLLIELQQWLSRFLLNYSHRVLGVAVSHLFSLVVHLLTIGILLLDLWLPLDCQHNLWLPQDVLTVRCSPITGVGNMLLVETGDELIGDGYHFPLHLDNTSDSVVLQVALFLALELASSLGYEVL